MDINVEVSKQLSYIDELLSNFGERIASCKNNEKKKEETQMPDSTTNTEKNNTILFSCGDDVLLANKDGKYYLGTIVEVSTSNDNDSSDVESDDPQFLIKFGDGTHAWASISQLKQLSAPPADDGRIMCVVCKGREATSGSAPNGVIACDMCGRGYHGRCHSPPIVAWVNGASWHCKRCVDQRYKVAAAENRAQKRSDMLRFKGGQQRRPQQDLTPPCDTISISSAEEPIEVRGSSSSDKKSMKAKVRASSSSDKKSLKAKDRGSSSSDKRSVKTKDRCSSSSDKKSVKTKDRCSSSSDKKSVKTKDRCSSRSDKKSVKTKDRCSSSSDKKSVKTKTASSSSAVNSQHVANDLDLHCYCDEKKDYLAQMLQCCRCSRWFHQRCVSSLRFPLYAGDKLYIFACATCNGGSEYLRRLELCWLELAHLALYNLTAYNAPNYFDLDKVIMPYIIDNWRALQLPEKMWRTPAIERREQILTALTSSRKRFKCGREMKKRATIWGLRLRRPPPPPSQLGNLEQLKKGVPLTDEIVREHSPRLRFLPREPYPPPETEVDDSTQPSSSQLDKISPYTTDDQGMIVPVDSEWLNLMMGKRFHENICNNPYSENDSNSTCSYESPKQTEVEEQPSPSQPSVSCSARESDTKADKRHETNTTNEATPICESPPVPSLVQCKVNLNNLSKDVSTLETSCVSEADTSGSKDNACTININSHSSRIATMNLEVSKQSTKNIIEQSKIMSLQHMGRFPAYTNGLFLELDSSGDEASKRGTLDTFIPPLKDFHGINNPFLMQFKQSSKGVSSKQNGKHCNGRFSLPMQFNPMMAPFARTVKRKLSEKDIIIGPNGEVKRRKFRRPRKYLQDQLNKSCPLPEDSKSVSTFTSPEIEMPAPKMKNDKRVKFQGRRLRERKEKNYYEKSRRNNTNNFNNTNNTINSVKSLQLSPHKGNNSTVNVDAQQLSVLKTTVQSYFRARSTFKILARRKTTGAQPAYLIEWDTTS